VSTLLFLSLLINLKFLLCRDAPSRVIPSIPVFSPPPSRHISYSPLDPLSYAPPYPISPSDPVTLISCYSCYIHLNHFRIEYTSGPVHINSLVQDDNWDGSLLVLRWVAANSMEIVGECEGRDFEGQRIVRFLIFMHFRVRRPEDVILIEGMRRLRQYPRAPDSLVFFARAQAIDLLPPPGPVFNLPISNLPSPFPSPSLSSSSNSIIRLIPSVLVTFLSHCSLV
jgi:hypothetical protein